MWRIVMVLMVLIAVTPAYGDQNNPELDVLFDRLKETLDTVEAAEITKQIWGNWYQSDMPEVVELMRRGEMSMRRARYDAAVKYFSQIIAKAPAFAEGWNRRATAYYMMGEYQRSSEDVAKTLDLEPRHFGALSGQGLIYLQLRQHEQALWYMNKALQQNPHLPALKYRIKAIQNMIDNETI